MNCHQVEPPKTEKILDHDWRHCPYILIRKALRILDATIPQRNDGRVIDILEEYMKATGPAYWLKDLPPLMRVLEILSVKHLEKPTYFAMLEKMLELCKVPPTVAKFSEAIDYFRDLEEYFSFLGYRLLKQDCLNNILVRLEPTWKERFPFTEPPIPRGDSTIQHYENISGVTWIFFKYLSKNEHHVIKTPKQYTLW
ncbi:unnamed protein product [Brassicogethes aeneus]|uniref:Cilia- and flagella-associated protein 69 ARM repeats domain-containing protein n=1 Tax=Brassicogethes aeneus TaxID=1431903 RepID=A0A9P0B929_BRAAE|nr:unnamed protein product [Brassicogethes aeneus]